MAYKELNNITLNTGYIAKDLDIINFNYIMSSVSTYVNQLNENIDYLKFALEINETKAVIELRSTDPNPAIEDINVGYIYFKQQ